MEDQSQRPAQIDLLRRLTPIELFVLHQRCQGMTSEEIGTMLDVPDETATYYLGNVYDKLGITYQHVGTSMGRLMAFCPVLDDIDAPPVPLRADIDPHAEPAPFRPSERSLDLVRIDDQAIRAQRGDDGAAADGGRGWIYGIGAAIAILLVAIFAVFLLVTGDDDDEDDADATATALAALATPTGEAEEPTPVEGAEETPTVEEPPTEEPTPSPEPEATPTEEPSPEPTETPEATPTETEEETATATPEPTATEEPTPGTETATPQPGATATPEPQTGTEIFDADWSEGPGDWVLTNGWTIEEAVLIGEGDDVQPLTAPLDLEVPDYAVEAIMTVEDLNDCDDDPVGLFVRINPRVDDDAEEYLAGYIGAVCEDDWAILAVEEEENDLEVLASGDFELDLESQPHTYRLEIVGEMIRLFVNEEFVGEATDDRYIEPGRAGLYFDDDEDDARVEVEAFTVFELEQPS